MRWKRSWRNEFLPDQIFQMAMRRDDHARVHLRSVGRRRRVRFRLLRARASSFACMVAACRRFRREKACRHEPARIFPGGARAAPVNAPFSWPNNSDSISSAGTAAQFRVTNGPARRALCSCSVRATSSLPVPVSPRMQTRVSLAATRRTCAINCSITGPCQMISCLPRRLLAVRDFRARGARA